MGDPVTVVIDGDPVAFARTRQGKQGVPITPDKQRAYARKASWLASLAMAGREPFDCALRMDLEAQFGIPDSWSKKRKDAALLGAIRPQSRPDLSNCIKLVEDAFNGIIFRDDALIVEYGAARKVYSAVPKVVVTVSPLPRAAREGSDRVEQGGPAR